MSILVHFICQVSVCPVSTVCLRNCNLIISIDKFGGNDTVGGTALVADHWRDPLSGSIINLLSGGWHYTLAGPPRPRSLMRA